MGANTGKYCKLVNKHNPAAKVFCFEPVQATFAKLGGMFGASPNVTLVNSGLFSEKKKLFINKYPSSTHASLYELKNVPYESVGKEEIDLITGDDFIKEHNIQFIDLLKLDIEGAELNALQGFKDALSKKMIRVIQFEYGYINITTKNLLVDYHEYLDSFGYVVGKLYPKSVEFKTYQFKHEDFIGPNMIAIRKDDAELKSLVS